ncbi:MAG: hypothetical protein EOP60_06615 [Sphingomonadales bacterium]|nr:MAG: hypothetical protein EOP60_06615 [Sphingomonadales bacterium]
MTDVQTDERKWGEQRLAGRKRQKVLVRGAMVAAALTFAILAPRLVPDGAAAPQAKLILAVIYIAAILLGAAWLWRRSDEVERRRACNTLAAMGLSGFVLTIVVMLAAPVFHLRNPAMIVWTIGLIVGGAAYIAQRLRN